MGNNTEELRLWIQDNIDLENDDSEFIAIDVNGSICGFTSKPPQIENNGVWYGFESVYLGDSKEPTNPEECCWQVITNLGKYGLVPVTPTVKQPNGVIDIVPLYDDFITPTYATEGSAAFDIRSPIDFELNENTTVEFGLGFKAKVPEWYAAFVLPRSGLGFKHGVHLRNTIGLIDSDYTGEWRVSLHLDMLNMFQRNEKGEPDLPIVKFKKFDRILQCVIIPVSQFGFNITDKLTETNRGEGGFGHTGLK